MNQTIGGTALVGVVLLAAGRTGTGLFLLACAFGLLFLVAKARAVTRPAAGRSVAGHGHGTQRTIARHEAGHAAAAQALGGKVRSVKVWENGGYTQATLPTADPQAAVTFWRAGRYAAGTGAGCSSDDSLVRKELRSVPAADRARVRRDADRAARRIVRQRSGQIRRDAQQLLRGSE